MKDLIPDIVRFAIGIREASVNSLSTRVSAIVDRKVQRGALVKSDWQLTAFVLDSKTTVLITLNTSYTKLKANGQLHTVYHLYVGPRELVYQVMEDFPKDEDLAALGDISLCEYVMGLYVDYQYVDSEDAELPLISNDEMAQLSRAARTLA